MNLDPGGRTLTNYRFTRAATCFAVAVLLCAACSSASPKASGGVGASGDTGAGGSSSVVDTAKQVVAAREAKVEFPALEPGPKAASNKKVFIISIIQAVEGANRETAAMQAAATAIGWNSTVIDGQADPAVIKQAIERAISEKADGILMASVGTALAPTAIADARAAGIPVVSMLAGNTPAANGVSAEVYSEDYNKELGRSEALYGIADSNGNAHVLALSDTGYASALSVYNGTVTQLKECSGCSVDTLDFTSADIASNLNGMITTALARNPGINYIAAEYDSPALVAAQAIKASGRNIKLLSTGGDKANLTLIASGTQAMTAGEAIEFTGWFAVDTMNRLFNGQPVVPLPSTGPNKILTKDNLPPTGQAWTGDSDFRPAFRTLWGK